MRDLNQNLSDAALTKLKEIGLGIVNFPPQYHYLNDTWFTIPVPEQYFFQ